VSTAISTRPAALSAQRIRELVRIAISLRWRLVRNRARRLGKYSNRLGVAAGVGYAVLSILGLMGAQFATDRVAERTVVLHLSAMALGWIFGPILLGGVDETVDPTRLALMPLKTSELFCVQVAGALSGIGPLAAMTALGLGLPLGFMSLSVGPPVIGPILGFLACALAAGAMIAMAVGLARSTAALLTIAQRSRRGRDLGVLIAALVGGSLFVIAQLAGRLGGTAGRRLVDGLAWTPWGWCAKAVIAVRDGSLATAYLWVVMAVVVATAAMWSWSRLTVFLLRNGELIARSHQRSGGPALRGARTEFGAALARQWIYLRRSPNQRVGLVFGTLFGVAFPVLQILQNGVERADGVIFGVLLAMLVNVGAAGNVIGFDAGSLWMEVLAGGPRRAQLLARSLGALPNLLLPTWLSGIVVSIWTQRFSSTLLVAFLAIPVAIIVLAEGLVTSTVAAFPISDGDNPFGNRQAMQGRGIRLVVAALVGLSAIGLLTMPVVIAAYLGRHEWWGWLSIGLGTLYALGVAALVLRWATRRLRGREPEFIALLAPRALV
jgi:ABC-2 type transport system permease protein